MSDEQKPTAPKREAKPTFGLVGNPDNTVYPFGNEVPEGFVFGKFAGLKKVDFAQEWFYLEHKAAECDAKAAALRTKAEESKKLGNSAQRGKTKRLMKLKEQLAVLTEQLSGQGIDVEALLADD